MALEVKRQNRETSQSLVRRFGQRVQRSGILIGARKKRFKGRIKSKTARKKQALRREELKAEYLKLEKLGKLPPKFRRR
ncbi:MAG: hypothetical protein Q8N16_00155 [bacterium]|nr:hypothetical protein [bacterium]